MRLAKLNTEESPQTAARFGIRSIPTLAVFRNGRETARESGAMDSGLPGSGRNPTAYAACAAKNW